MKYCTKCGAQIVDEAIFCTGCGCRVAEEPQTDRQRMKYCTKCGAQMMDEAVVCIRCGCSATGEQQAFHQHKKYCTKCGAEMLEEAVVCVKCGCMTQETPRAYAGTKEKKSDGLVTAAKILMIIGTVYTSLLTFCVGLAWCLPMTLSYFNKVKQGIPVTTGFKVCSLLFVNMVAGILMLCDNDQ